MSQPDSGSVLRGHSSVERFFQFSLLGLVASGYLAVAGSGYLDTPTIILTAAGLLLRGLMVCGWLRLELTDRVTTLATLAYIGFYAVDYFFLSREFLPCTVHLVFFLAVMKILTSRNSRDYLYVAVIAFLELLAAAILSIGFNFIVFLTLYLMFAIAALTSGEIRRSSHRAVATARSGLKRFHPRLALLTIWVGLGILVLTAGMFFLLPRTADAALSTLLSHRIFIPGLSSHVTLGEIGELKTSSRPIMHVQLYVSLPPGPLKWRGGVMTDFDGKVWSEPDRRAEIRATQAGRINLATENRSPGGHTISYRVELEALDSNTLFFAGNPQRIEGLPDSNIRRFPDTGCIRLMHRPPPGFRYEAFSLLEDLPETAPPLNPPPVLELRNREQYLQLPPLDARIPTLARSMTAGLTTDLARARGVETRLRTDYGYTLTLPDREAADPLAYFLFTRKKGHCEYFASSMAVLLRSLGIPTRLATGFQSGVYNPMTDLWLIRASDAHSWVEAWIPGHGWTTFDPTPPDPNQHETSLLSRLNLYIDAAETFWQSWVVGYDPGRQGSLADHILGLRWLDTASTATARWDAEGKAWLRRYGLQAGLGSVGLICLWFVAPHLIRVVRFRRRVERARRGQASVADATLLYQRMLHIVRVHGYQKPAWFTPAEFARSLPVTNLGHAVREFTAAYNALRFGGRADAAPRLSILLDDLERVPR